MTNNIVAFEFNLTPAAVGRVLEEAVSGKVQRVRVVTGLGLEVYWLSDNELGEKTWQRMGSHCSLRFGSGSVGWTAITAIAMRAAVSTPPKHERRMENGAVIYDLGTI